MEFHIFIACDEFVELLNRTATEADCRILVTESHETPYKALTAIDVAGVLRSRNIELGFLAEGAKLLRKPVKDIYREDRIGFISVHSGCETKDESVLLESTFAADSSASARKIFKVLKKLIGGMSKKGVKVINERTGDTRISGSIYWTLGAVATGKTWKQAENSWVRFEPVEPESIV